MKTTNQQLCDDGLMTVNDVAAFLRVSRPSVYKLVNESKLACIQIGSRKRITRKSVEALVSESLMKLRDQ